MLASETSLPGAASSDEALKEIDTMKKLSKRVRGASLVEYALLLVGVLIIAAAAVKTIGPKVEQAATKAEAEL
jgi:Flp pilus assembly pilin Flp